MTRRFAVVGDPIAHSLSPMLHTTAYQALGLDWEYGRVRVVEGGLESFVDGCDNSWGGLSVTMPLKTEAFALCDEVDELAHRTDAVNTLVFDQRGDTPNIRGFNTDVEGIAYPLSRLGLPASPSALVIGAGATARSVLVALSLLGFRDLIVSARDANRAESLCVRGRTLGMTCHSVPLAALSEIDATDVTVSTLPANAGVALDARANNQGDVLFDVAYAPWPNSNSRLWIERGGVAISGLSMLAAQALAQVRAFVNGDPRVALVGEEGVRVAMNRSVGLDDEGVRTPSVG